MSVYTAVNSAERVGVALDVPAGKGGCGGTLGCQQRRVLLDDLVGPAAVADPQMVRVVGRPRQGRLVAVDLRQPVAPTGGDLADRAHATGAAVEAQQQAGGVVALHLLTNGDIVADPAGGERLHFTGGPAPLGDERVQVGAHLDDV